MEYHKNRLATGIRGLDEILHGGLLPERAYLVCGGPGTGKTTLGLHFLLAGQEHGSLFVSLGESEAQIRSNALSTGLDLEKVDVLDLSPGTGEDDGAAYNLLESWDVEGTRIHDQIIEHVRKARPARVVIDSMTHLRYLSANPFQYRKQLMSLLRKLTLEGSTVLFTSEEKTQEEDEILHFLSDGVIQLEITTHGRICQVRKLRGSGFSEGAHYYALQEQGLALYPRLIPREHRQEFTSESISSGMQALDELTHGGIERGTITLISGPTGVGKTTLGAQFMEEAANRGEHSVIYSFDEGSGTFFQRCKQINLSAEEMVAQGNLRFEAIEPLHYNPDQFSAMVRRDVEDQGASIVMLDSISGYRQSVRGEHLQTRIHALCRYLMKMGVTVILINESFSVTGEQMRATEHDISYLADTIILLRYLELSGEMRKTIGILKKRTSDFEKTLREFEITSEGIRIGRPMTGLRGILSGIPEMLGGEQEDSG